MGLSNYHLNITYFSFCSTVAFIAASFYRYCERSRNGHEGNNWGAKTSVIFMIKCCGLVIWCLLQLFYYCLHLFLRWPCSCFIIAGGRCWDCSQDAGPCPCRRSPSSSLAYSHVHTKCRQQTASKQVRQLNIMLVCLGWTDCQHICPLFSGFSIVCHPACVWPTALKRG